MKISITGTETTIGAKLYSKLKNYKRIDTKVLVEHRHSLLYKESLKSFTKDADVVIHLLEVMACTNRHEYLDNNTKATIGLVDAIKQYGKPNAKIIFASTSAVYSDTTGVIRETTDTNPDSLYGWSKYFAEQYILSSGLEYVIFRMSDYGEESIDSFVKAYILGLKLKEGIYNLSTNSHVSSLKLKRNGWTV